MVAKENLTHLLASSFSNPNLRRDKIRRVSKVYCIDLTFLLQRGNSNTRFHFHCEKFQRIWPRSTKLLRKIQMTVVTVRTVTPQVRVKVSRRKKCNKF